MKLNRILVVLLLLAMSIALFACNETYDNDKSANVLLDSIKASFDADSSFIKIKSTDKNDAELQTKMVVNTYISKDKKYTPNTRLSYIYELREDENGKNLGSVTYWAGKEKNNDQSYVIKLEKAINANNTTSAYSRQKIDTDDIFTFDTFKKYEKKEMLKSIYNLSADNFTIVDGKREGKVEYIKFKVDESYDTTLGKLGTLTARIINGKLTCIQASSEKTTAGFAETTVSFQIDFLLAGNYINIPTTSGELKDNSTANTTFTDNAVIVK